MDKAAELYIVRHGETFWNREKRIQGQLDCELSPTGRRQVEALATGLQQHTFDAIYSSDLQRAYDTAYATAKYLSMPVQTKTCLRERHFGVLQGLCVEEAREQLPEVVRNYQNQPDYHIPQGESPAQFSRRCLDCLEALATAHDGGKILVATHGGVLKRLLIHIFALSGGNPFPFRVYNAAINVFQFSPQSGWFLDSWGIRGHLAD